MATTSRASGFSANERRKRMTCTNHVAHVRLNAHVSLWFHGDLQNCCDCGKNPLRNVTSPEGAIRDLRARLPGAVHTRPGPGYRCEGRPYSARPRITARAAPRVVHTRPDSGFEVRFSSAASAHVCLGPFILDPARAIAARVVHTRPDPALRRVLRRESSILGPTLASE